MTSDQPMTYEEFKPFLLIAGLTFMLIAAFILIFVSLNAPGYFGVALLAVVGLGMTVGGSPEPKEVKKP